MKLYRVAVETVVFVVAKDEAGAIDAAEMAAQARDGGVEFTSWTTLITRASANTSIPSDWIDAIPYGYERNNPNEKTIGELIKTITETGEVSL